jgi:hypothetical protein
LFWPSQSDRPYSLHLFVLLQSGKVGFSAHEDC